MSHDSTRAATFSLRPLGWVRSPYRERFGTPQQAAARDSDAEAYLDLDPELAPAASLRDLEGMERIWVLSVLHLVDGWRPTVRPPRGPMQRRGVFATRSPHRPNPIGLSAVRLVRIEGSTLVVRGVDLLDGTPILDVKPYLPYADSFPDAKAGWIDTIPKDAPQTGRSMGARHRRKLAAATSGTDDAPRAAADPEPSVAAPAPPCDETPH